VDFYGFPLAYYYHSQLKNYRKFIELSLMNATPDMSRNFKLQAKV
jgi:hypothetical protein